MSDRLRARPFGRTLAGVVALVAITGLVVASTGSTANQPEPAGYAGLENSSRAFGAGGGKQTLMVQLSGDPVTVTAAKSTVDLNQAQENALQAGLESRQDALKDAIAALGGTVLADYQLAYNGIKVSIDPSKVSELEFLPGVEAVRRIEIMERDNVRGVQYIGAPAVWGGLSNLHGEGIKVAIIDTGLDYTHANFGGPGTVAAYQAANATDTLPPALGTFGPRYKGGIDLVGDDYNASAPDGDPDLIPHPDPNPLDCNGHGTHVAGSAVGSGVLSNGMEYTGPYNETTISSNTWRIAPGVAPEADIYAVRVFGCAGSTDVTVDAIEWAVDNDMDVINMSLGSPYGQTTDPSAVATTNAAIAGVIVVTSTGNNGPNQYLAGSPGSAAGAIATAAQDVWETIPGVRVQTSAGLDTNGINANGHTFAGPISGPLVVLQDNPATTTDEPNRLGSADESLGCSVSAYTFNGVDPGEIAVARRGACARVAKAIFGDQAGAAAVIMTNNAAGLPPFEGQITSNPDTGEPYVVDIPFVGVSGNQDTAGTPSFQLRASPPGTTVTLSPIDLPNNNFRGFASFTSGGPRADSFLKPDVTAPGVSIISAGNGTGNGIAILSGTSMASPHNAGATALVRQAHPTWSVSHIKAAVVNTADPGITSSTTTPFRISRGGSGTIQPAKAVATDVVAYASETSAFDVHVNYGFRELGANFVQTRTITLENNGVSSATFDVTQATPQGSPHTVTFPDGPSVTVPAGGRADVEVTLTVPAATVGTSTGTTANPLAFQEVAGLVTFTPQVESNNGVTLRVPYYLVPRALSKVEAAVGSGTLSPGSTATINLTNGGVIAGGADFYAWGISDADDSDAMADSAADIRAVGVQSFPGPSAGLPATERLLVFAVNTWDKWTNASVNEFDILVDVDPQNGNGDDYEIVGADQGAIQTGTDNGRMAAFVFSTRSAGSQVAFFATAPTDSSTALLPIRTAHLCRTGQPCLNEANPRFTYHAVSFDRDDGGSDTAAGPGRFNAWSPAITTGGSETVAPGATGTEAVTIDAAEWALTPALGLMIVVLDNQAGADEAKLLSAQPAVAAAPPPPPPPPAVAVPVADLSITKAGNPGTVTLGGNVTYTLTVRNAGPSTATGVVAADQLPAGATFVSATSTQGTCANAGGVVSCTIGTMASGATVTITVVVRPTAAGTINNVATVVSNVGDSNAANNTASATTVVQAPPREPAARPRPAVCSSLVVTPRSLKVGTRSTITARVRLSNRRPMANAQVRLTAPGINVTRRTNAQGIVRFAVRPRRAGIARVTVLRSPQCTTARVGIVGVIAQPPLTG